MPIIGLDIGTSGCKCTVFDYEGNVRSFSYREYYTENPKRGQYELNPQKVWDAVKYVIYQASHEYGNKQLSEATVISVSSFGEAAVPVDKNGKILYNSILYTDSRGMEQANYLADRMGSCKIMELTGLPVHCMYTVNKLMWIKENMRDVYERMWKFLLFEDFIIYKLTGLPVIDYSLASRTMAFNILEKKWESVILNEAGLKDHLFSEAKPSGTIVGTIKKDIAEELKLYTSTLVATGGHDQVCAVLGTGILTGGMAVDGMGTSECITTVFDRPVLNEKMLRYNFNCEPHAIDGRYLTLSFTFSGGSLVKWYRNCFGEKEKAEAEKENVSVYKILDRKAAKEKPAPILVLPHFSGSGTPYMDPCSAGAIVGLTLDTTGPQIYRSILEGINYEMRYNLECLEKCGIVVNSLRAAGGGAKSDLWLQIKADIMGRKIEVMEMEEAGTLGTAMLAGVAAGIYPSLESAVGKLVKVKKEFYPDTRAHKVYNEYYDSYKRLYQAVKSIYNNNNQEG